MKVNEWTIFLNCNLHIMTLSWIFLVFHIASNKCYHFLPVKKLSVFFSSSSPKASFLLIPNITFHYLTSFSKVFPIPRTDDFRTSLIGFPDLKGTIFKSLTLYYISDRGKHCNFRWESIVVHINKMLKIILKTTKDYNAVD